MDHPSRAQCGGAAGPTQKASRMSISRRAFLATAATLGIGTGTALLSGCASSGTNVTGPSGSPSSLEVFSWWTEGGEKAALNSLVSEFHVHNPHIDFVNRAVAGGAGTNAKAELARRLKAGDPPDTFQGQAGAMLDDYVDAGQLEDLGFLYQQQGWDRALNSTLLQLTQRAGKHWSVPLDIHHINVIWANKRVCDHAKAPVAPDNVPDFVTALHRVAATGKNPLAISATAAEIWQVKHLMECLLVAEVGPAGWPALWKAGGDWGTQQVSTALAALRQILALAVNPTAEVSWDKASAMVGSGEAAYQIMGDWTEASFTLAGLLPHRDYDWAPAPGTDGTFVFASDCFTLPKGAKDRDAAIAWLVECGSQAGQDSFTAVKGAIPPRSVIGSTERGLFDEYSNWSMQQWTGTQIVGSLTHGVVARAAWNSAIDSALLSFAANRDPVRLQTALQAAAKQYAA
ncbi:glucose/mannose transport system substrate-binding protein [Streptacidiphilus jiangxiensis]|uniref:Glucose/mannose transport system substrate-binding protein n=2 Tax=Streptacidiphilus jiangxiensis TaxID=235985 RepID=A0A1H7LUV5_STRJI|nr:glucose/mannose transport system substrate-binding protein [Streptacidiphilus jiangxiensis]